MLMCFFLNNNTILNKNIVKVNSTISNYQAESNNYIWEYDQPTKQLHIYIIYCNKLKKKTNFNKFEERLLLLPYQNQALTKQHQNTHTHTHTYPSYFQVIVINRSKYCNYINFIRRRQYLQQKRETMHSFSPNSFDLEMNIYNNILQSLDYINTNIICD